MVITRRWLVAAVAVSLSASACKKDDAPKGDKDDKAAEKADDKKADDKADDKAEKAAKKNADPKVVDSVKTPDAPAPAPAQTPPAPQPGALAIVGGSNPASNADLAILPVDSEIVAGINVAQMQKSALYKQYALPLLSQKATQLNAVKSSCGFDPLQTITSVTLGLKNVTANPEVVLVVHGIQKDKMMGPCLAKIKAEASKDGTVVNTDGGVVTFVGKKPGETAAFMFTDASTLVAAYGPNGTKIGIATLAQGGSPLAKSAGFIDMYSKINTNESVWALANGNSHAFDKLAAVVKPQAVFGSLNFTDQISLDVRMRVDSDDQAKSLAGMGQSQQAATKQFFNRFDVTTEGRDIHVGLAMTVEQIKKMQQQFGGMLGGMGGQ